MDLQSDLINSKPENICEQLRKILILISELKQEITIRKMNYLHIDDKKVLSKFIHKFKHFLEFDENYSEKTSTEIFFKKFQTEIKNLDHIASKLYDVMSF